MDLGLTLAIQVGACRYSILSDAFIGSRVRSGRFFLVTSFVKQFFSNFILPSLMKG